LGNKKEVKKGQQEEEGSEGGYIAPGEQGEIMTTLDLVDAHIKFVPRGNQGKITSKRSSAKCSTVEETGRGKSEEVGRKGGKEQQGACLLPSNSASSPSSLLSPSASFSTKNSTTTMSIPWEEMVVKKIIRVAARGEKQKGGEGGEEENQKHTSAVAVGNTNNPSSAEFIEKMIHEPPSQQQQQQQNHQQKGDAENTITDKSGEPTAGDSNSSSAVMMLSSSKYNDDNKSGKKLCPVSIGSKCGESLMLMIPLKYFRDIVSKKKEEVLLSSSSSSSKVGSFFALFSYCISFIEAPIEYQTKKSSISLSISGLRRWSCINTVLKDNKNQINWQDLGRVGPYDIILQKSGQVTFKLDQEFCQYLEGSDEENDSNVMKVLRISVDCDEMMEGQEVTIWNCCVKYIVDDPVEAAAAVARLARDDDIGEMTKERNDKQEKESQEPDKEDHLVTGSSSAATNYDYVKEGDQQQQQPMMINSLQDAKKNSNYNFAMTRHPGMLQVVHPLGGESFRAGSSLKVEWTYSGNVGTYVSIKLFRASMSQEGFEEENLEATIATFINVQRCQFEVTLPINLRPSDNYRLEMASHDNPIVSRHRAHHAMSSHGL